MEKKSLLVPCVVLVVVILHVIMAIWVMQVYKEIIEENERVYFREPRGDEEVERFAKATVVLEPQVR